MDGLQPMPELPTSARGYGQRKPKKSNNFRLNMETMFENPRPAPEPPIFTNPRPAPLPPTKLVKKKSLGDIISKASLSAKKSASNLRGMAFKANKEPKGKEKEKEEEKKEEKAEKEAKGKGKWKLSPLLETEEEYEYTPVPFKVLGKAPVITTPAHVSRAERQEIAPWERFN